jgi:hypothetical protein
MNKTLISCLVRAADGVIDPVKTKEKYDDALTSQSIEKLEEYEKKLINDTKIALDKFDADLKEYMDIRTSWDTRSAAAVNAIFGRYGSVSPNGSIVKPMLLSMASNLMLNEGSIKVGELKLAEQMIADYLSDNEGILFSIEKGKGGGVKLIAG